MAQNTKCKNCPLKSLSNFRAFEPSELEFVSSFKTGELSADPGSSVMVEGSHSAHLYTILQGWAFRYKMLEDGRRQILNYVVPGDLIGLQGSLTGEMQHSIEALTSVTLCVFERDRITELFRNHPTLAYDLTWMAAREERILDDHLLSLGRRSALERTAYLLAFLNHRAEGAGVFKTATKIIPLTQQHIADTLGLSLVHTNKTIKKLRERELVKWLDRGVQVINAQGLASLSGWEMDTEKARPFI